jgi:hypothetical protein
MSMSHAIGTNQRTLVKNRILLASAMAASILLLAGCDGSRTSDYPDHSVDTTRRVDDIKQNARDQKDAVDADADRVSTRMDFDERQIREKYKAMRQSSVNEGAGAATDREAKNREIQIQAKHDKDVVDAEVADKLRTTPPEKAAEIHADAASRKSEIDNAATGKLEPILSETERGKAKDIQRGLELDRDESKEISGLEQERSKARNETRERKLKIDKWTNDELATVEKDTSPAGK